MNRILAIDDTPDNLVSIRALLKMLIPGCRVFTAASGRDGIAEAVEEQPDAILLDIHMPEMNGLELLQAINTEGIKTSFGFVTSEGTPEMRQKIYIHSMENYTP